MLQVREVCTQMLLCMPAEYISFSGTGSLEINWTDPQYGANLCVRTWAISLFAERHLSGSSLVEMMLYQGQIRKYISDYGLLLTSKYGANLCVRIWAISLFAERHLSGSKSC